MRRRVAASERRTSVEYRLRLGREPASLRPSQLPTQISKGTFAKTFRAIQTWPNEADFRFLRLSALIVAADANHVGVAGTPGRDTAFQAEASCRRPL